MDMGTFYLMINCLAYIMEQTSPTGQLLISTYPSCHNCSQVSYFNGMLEHILSIAGAEPQPSQQLDQLWVKAVYIGIEGGLLTFLPNNSLTSRRAFSTISSILAG